MITLAQAREQMATLEASWGTDDRPSRAFLTPDIRRMQRVVDATLAGPPAPRMSSRAAPSPAQLAAALAACNAIDAILPQLPRLPVLKQREIIDKLAPIVRDLQALVKTARSRA